MLVYPEASAHGGQLVHRNGIPILVTDGGPEEVGLQVGTLAMRYATELYRYPLDYLRTKIRIPLLPHVMWMLLKRKCRQLYAQIPDDDRAEIVAITKACPDRGALVPGNTLFDMTNMGLRPLLGCSSYIVPPERSTNGNLLFGRNLDFEPLTFLFKYSLVQVYRRSSQRMAFASIGFPGFVGCFSAMNETGLSMARHEVVTPNVPRSYNSHGVPFGVALRRVMERCSTVREAIDYLAPIKHSTVNLVLLADATTIAILEVTPDGVYERPATTGMIGCSNHFLHPSLKNPRQSNQYVTLNRQATLDEMAVHAPPKIGVTEIWDALHQVRDPNETLQTMVFEPATRTLHLGFGEVPTTGRPPVAVSMGEFFG